MPLTTRQYLKRLDEQTFKKLLKISNLSELEYWILYYSYKKRMVENTCMKLHISKTTYHSILNVALAKVEITLYIVRNSSLLSS